MIDLFDQQERENELRDFDAVWPGDDPREIIDAFRAAYKEATGIDGHAVTLKNGVYTIHFIFFGAHEYTAEQMKKCTEISKHHLMGAVNP